MGRPLNKKYFGNTNEDGVGGEGVASVAIASPITGTFDGTVTVTFSAPQIAGGTTATGTVTTDVNDDIVAIVVTDPGSGYTSLPSITISSDTDNPTYTSGNAGITITLTTTSVNAIVPQVRISSTNRTSGNDIVKQVSSKRFRVTSEDGTAVCTLVGSTPDAAGEMAIVATDASAGTYWVTKISSRKATLIRNTGTVFADGASVPWTFGTATATVCKINNA